MAVAIVGHDCPTSLKSDTGYVAISATHEEVARRFAAVTLSKVAVDKRFGGSSHVSSPIWGPFDSAPEAADHLCRFTDSVLEPGLGVTWLSDGTLYALRQPRFDIDGNGQVITYGVRPAPVPPAPPPKGFGQRVKSWFWRQMAIQGEMQIQQGEADLAMGQAIDGAIAAAYRKITGKYREDTEGMAFDVAAALSAFLLLTGTAEVLGVMAAVGGVALLVLDGAA